MNEARTAALSGRLGSRITARRANAARALATAGTPAALAALAGTFGERDPDVVSQIAERRLAEPCWQAATDAAWQVWAESRNERLLSALLAAPGSPSDRELRTLQLFLSGEGVLLEEQGLAVGRLRGVYATAGSQLRERLARQAREQGRRDWVELVVGPPAGDRLETLSEGEWESIIALLDYDGGRAESWRLARVAPPRWRQRLLRTLIDSGWQPQRDVDRAQLRTLCAVTTRPRHHDAGELTPAGILHHDDYGVSCMAFGRDRDLFATGAYHGGVRLWRTADTTLQARLTGHTGVGCVAFSPDGLLIATASGAADPAYDDYVNDGTVRLWRTSDGAHRVTLESARRGRGWMAFSPDGELLATKGRQRDTIRLWRISDAACVVTLRRRGLWARGVAFSPDGSLSLLATGPRDGAVRLWPIADAPAKARSKHGPPGYLALSPDGGLYVTGAAAGCVRLWRTGDAAPIGTLQSGSPHPSVDALAFSPDGSLLAVGARCVGHESTVRLWRTADATLTATLENHTGCISGMAFSPCGTLLATRYSGSGTVLLWQASRMARGSATG